MRGASLKNAATLATLAALVLLAAVLAYWSWRWVAPPPASRAPAAELAAGAAADGLFGKLSSASSAVAPPSAVRLMGVVAAATGRSGYAVLKMDAKKAVAVPQGEDIEPGLRLAEVHADHVVLERNGAREKLAWPQKGGK